MDRAYFDLYGVPTQLTDEEISWFLEVCEVCKKATGIDVEITCKIHDWLPGKAKEALGVIYTDGDRFWITIDTYFIHECYEEKFNGGFNLAFEDLQRVIAHELAHITQWRHCKRHTKITEDLYAKIMAYQENKEDTK